MHALPEKSALLGLSIAVDVQHLYRTGLRAKDQGAIYKLEGGGKVTEGWAATQYALALSRFLEDRGARVIRNDPKTNVLVGPYSRRTSQAQSAGCQAYLACHLNAGKGYYALTRYLNPDPAQFLATCIAHQLDTDFAEILGGKVLVLAPGDRGRVCVAGFGGAGVLLEPVFGDTPAQQTLLTALGLSRVGQTIGAGVLWWWRQRGQKITPA